MEFTRKAGLFVFRSSAVIVALSLTFLCWMAYESKEEQKQEVLTKLTKEDNELIKFKCYLCNKVKVAKRKNTYSIIDKTVDGRDFSGDDLKQTFEERLGSFMGEHPGVVCKSCFGKH